jgi:hypothetical protein
MSALSLPTRLHGLSREALLRLALKLDAVVTGANGLAYLGAADPLHDLLGLEPALLRGVGAFLVAFAALVWTAATRPAIPRAAVTAIVIANGAWAAGSLVFVTAGISSPWTVGSIWIALQALVVAGFAALQWRFARP